MQTESSTTSSEPAPESAAPKKGNKKKLWIIIAAVVVVALLIGATAYVFLLNPKLEAEIGPSPITVDAGKQKALWVNATYGGDAVTTDVTYAWSVPATLGSLNVVAQKQVTFTATDTGFSGNNAIVGTITCAVTYKGDTVTVTEDVTVNPPSLDSVSVLGDPTLEPLESGTYSADALNSVGGNVTSSCSFQWSVTGMAAADYTLSPTTGVSVVFTGLVEGIATLTVAGTYLSVTKSGSMIITVSATTAVRTVDYYWYDMFNVSYNNEWWLTRGPATGNDYVLSTSYPYLELWSGTQPGDTYIYGGMRMDVTARNLTEMNMVSHPEILPYLGAARGGTAVVDWELGYITYDRGDIDIGISPGMMAWYDGWFVELNGTVTLDRQAAMAVLGVTSSGFDDFANWWADNGAGVQSDWGDWMLNEANNASRLDIFNAYEYWLQPMFWGIDAQKVGDQVVVSIESVSWGGEVLMTRWLQEAFMPTEWYFEDFSMHATIGPETTDMDINTGVAYATYAYIDTLYSKPCWAWEAMRQDYVPSSLEYPVSEFDKYIGKTYLNEAPGSDYYGLDMDWDYVPGAWNLSENEVLTLEWPSGPVIFKVHEAPGLTSNVTSNMTCVYAEPMPSDDSSKIVIDDSARTITYTGPFDMWTWSSTQTTHAELADEWDRVGLLPYGIPYVEFAQETGGEPPYAADLEMTGIPETALVGETIDFDVAVFDQFVDPYPDYTGTVEFASSDGAATLPGPYQYSGSESTHAFQMVFNTAGTHSVHVEDQVNPVLRDDVLGVVVSETQVYHFVVVVNEPALGVIADEETTATVTIQNQHDVTYTGYTGTVAFTSTDSAATLPPNYPFVAGDAGTKAFSVTFGTAGTQALTVTDVADASVNGSDDLVVQAAAAASYLVLEVPGGLAQMDIAADLIITVYDQYDRVYTPYAGTITFSTNRSGEVTLPVDYTFDGTEGGTVTLQVTFTASGMFLVSAVDTVDSGVTGSVEVLVVTELPVLDHFVVSGITNMWEDNYSDVTVEAITQFSTRFIDYVGTVHFTSDAASGATLPADTPFTVGDAGIMTLPDAVSFADPGTYTVTVEDTVDPSAQGSQPNILIEDLVPTTLTISGAPDWVVTGGTISLTVTIYDQYGNVEDEYTGTVTFSSGDSSATLPADFTFVSGYAGTHEFVDEITLVTLGDQTVTVEDTVDAGLADTITVTVVGPEGLPKMTYTLYDMFQEPWGEWWDLRPSSAWKNDYILSDVDGKYTLLYNPLGKPKAAGTTFLLYAPYRWSVDGKNLSADETSVNVYSPEFWPKLGTTDVSGSQATMGIYMQYISTDWWNSYWLPTWSGYYGWPGDDYYTYNDGWYAASVYEIKMNPEAAETWMGIPVSDDPVAWWNTNEVDYVDAWTAWVENEGNTRLDIYNGYDYAYYALATMGDLSVALDGDIVFKLAHISWGYEILLTRWLTEANLCLHEPYYEDTTINVTYDANMINFTLDGVCQYSLHAVKANESSSNDAAWAWEPQNIDYIPSSAQHPNSDFDPYYPLTYQSWNSGDEEFGNEVGYDASVTTLNLANYASLVVKLNPGTDQIGYLGQGVADGSGTGLPGDKTPWSDLEMAGEMSLGYYVTNPADPLDLDSMYDPSTKTLMIEGPFTFDNPRGGGILYHGAPWLEFNVTPLMGAVTTGIEASSLSESASASSAVTEVLTLAAVLSIVLVTLAAFGATISRGREY